MLHYWRQAGYIGRVPRYRLTPNVLRDGQRREHVEGEPVLPLAMWHLAEGGDIPGKLWFRLGRSAAGEWVCREVEISSDRPLTTSVLRAIPLTRIIDEFLVRKWSFEDKGGALDPVTGIREWYGPVESTGADYMQNTDRPAVTHRRTTRRGGSGPTVQELADFAANYRWALTHDRQRPVASAAERSGITRATAHRWLARIKEQEAIGDRD